MEKNGLNSRNEREATLAKLASAFRSIASSEDRSGYNAALKELSSVLFEASRDGNALHALKLERQCIAVEQYLKETDSDILDKQLSRSGEAELSLKLVQDPKTYREHVESGKAGEGNPGTQPHRGAKDFCRTAQGWPDIQR